MPVIQSASGSSVNAEKYDPDTFRACEQKGGMCMQSMRRYEVLKFVEHDGAGRLSVDEAEGTLLIYRIQEEAGIEKDQVLRWIRQIVTQLDLYQRSGENPEQIRCYRYLNPYSVLITAEDQVMLLNLEDPRNEFVIRNMQKRSMRHHFVRSVQNIGEHSKMAVDLYSLGKTVQFLLACTEITPALRFREEYQLTRFVQKCLQTEEQKRYQHLKEALKDLPREKKAGRAGRSGRMERRFGENGNRGKYILAVGGIAAVILVGIFLTREPVVSGDNGTLESSAQGVGKGRKTGAVKVAKISEGKSGTAGGNGKTGESSEKSGDGTIKSGSAILAEQGKIQEDKLKTAFEEKEQEPQSAEQIYQEYQKTTCDLAKAYEEEGRKEDALSLYEALLKSECVDELKEEAYVGKIRLELELDKKDQAKATYEEGKKTFPESEKLKQYEDQFKQEEQKPEGNGETGEEGKTES